MVKAKKIWLVCCILIFSSTLLAQDITRYKRGSSHDLLIIGKDIIPLLTYHEKTLKKYYSHEVVQLAMKMRPAIHQHLKDNNILDIKGKKFGDFDALNRASIVVGPLGDKLHLSFHVPLTKGLLVLSVAEQDGRLIVEKDIQDF